MDEVSLRKFLFRNRYELLFTMLCREFESVVLSSNVLECTQTQLKLTAGSCIPRKLSGGADKKTQGQLAGPISGT
jgi:hypothetical protein